MGGGMSSNLARAGHTIHVYDRVATAVERVVEAGAIAEESAAEVASKVDILFLCLPDAEPVAEAMFEPNGIVGNAAEGLRIIDHTTMNRAAAVDIGTRAQAHGIAYADCPVSGGPAGADAGTLTVMFGGDESLFDSVKQLLEITGDALSYCGELGSGQLMKAINNIIYDVNIAAICEVVPLALKAGLDPDVLCDVVTSGSSRSYASQNFIPKIRKRQFSGDFPMQAAYKDILNVQEVATELRAPTPVVNAMIAVYQQALTAGYGADPKSSIIKLYEQALGVELRE